MKNLAEFRQSLVTEALKQKPKPTLNKPQASKPSKPETDPTTKPPYVVDNLAILKNIVVKHKADTIFFGDKSELDVEPPEANAVVSLYARLTRENKKKVEILLTKGVSTFLRLVKFAMSNS